MHNVLYAESRFFVTAKRQLGGRQRLLVDMYISACEHISICIHICAHTYIHISIYAYEYSTYSLPNPDPLPPPKGTFGAAKYIRWHVNLYTCAYVYLYTYMYTHTHICIRMHNVLFAESRFFTTAKGQLWRRQIILVDPRRPCVKRWWFFSKVSTPQIEPCKLTTQLTFEKFHGDPRRVLVNLHRPCVERWCHFLNVSTPQIELCKLTTQLTSEKFQRIHGVPASSADDISHQPAHHEFEY